MITPTITELSQKEIRELARKIRPVFMFPIKGRCYVRRYDPFLDFIQDPKAESEAVNLQPFMMITTFHRPAENGLFLATIAEVLTQIPRSPEEIFHRVVAFEILRKPKVDIDRNTERDARRQGLLVAKTRLFEQAFV